MNEKNRTHKKTPSLKDFLFPGIVALFIWLFLHFLYDLLGFIDNKQVYRTLAAVNWILIVISVGFSGLIVYYKSYFKGASPGVRIFAVYIVPLGWCIKEFIRVSANVTIPEALFYTFFTPVQLMMLIGQMGIIGIVEIICRRQVKKQDSNQRIISAIPVIAIIFSTVSLYFILIRSGGYDFHLMVKMIYRSLFL